MLLQAFERPDHSVYATLFTQSDPLCRFQIFSLFRIVKEQILHSTPLPVRSEVISDCMVELSGIEPLTSCVQGRRSPS